MDETYGKDDIVSFLHFRCDRLEGIVIRTRECGDTSKADAGDKHRHSPELRIHIDFSSLQSLVPEFAITVATLPKLIRIKVTLSRARCCPPRTDALCASVRKTRKSKIRRP